MLQLANEASSEGATQKIPIGFASTPDFLPSFFLLSCLLSFTHTHGAQVRDFENRVAARVGRRCGVACSSGTAALDLAFAALKASSFAPGM